MTRNAGDLNKPQRPSSDTGKNVLGWKEYFVGRKILFLGYLKYFKQYIPITNRVPSFSTSTYGSSADHEDYELTRKKQGTIT